MIPLYPTIHVRLTGENGNAFMIIGRIEQGLRSAKIPAEEISKFREEAMSGDYNNVLQTAMKWVEVS